MALWFLLPPFYRAGGFLYEIVESLFWNWNHMKLGYLIWWLAPLCLRRRFPSRNTRLGWVFVLVCSFLLLSTYGSSAEVRFEKCDLLFFWECVVTVRWDHELVIWWYDMIWYVLLCFFVRWGPHELRSTWRWDEATICRYFNYADGSW